MRKFSHAKTSATALHPLPLVVLPWNMVFPQADALPRHLSQHYEFMLAGIWMLRRAYLHGRS
jgi:hypothetical protein